MKPTRLMLWLAAFAVGGVRAHAAPPSRPAGQVLAHRFGEAVADAPAEVEVLVRPRHGDVHPGGASGRERIDVADYSRILVLTLRRELVAGPSSPPVLLRVGAYEGDVLPAPDGRIRLVLHGDDGMSVSLVLGELATSTTPPKAAAADAQDDPGGAWIVALRLPTAAGTLVLAPSGDAGPLRTRTDVIRHELRERLLHSGRAPRRPSRAP